MCNFSWYVEKSWMALIPLLWPTWTCSLSRAAMRFQHRLKSKSRLFLSILSIAKCERPPPHPQSSKYRSNCIRLMQPPTRRTSSRQTPSRAPTIPWYIRSQLIRSTRTRHPRCSTRQLQVFLIFDVQQLDNVVVDRSVPCEALQLATPELQKEITGGVVPSESQRDMVNAKEEPNQYQDPVHVFDPDLNVDCVLVQVAFLAGVVSFTVMCRSNVVCVCLWINRPTGNAT